MLKKGNQTKKDECERAKFVTAERQKMKDMIEEMRERIKEKYGRVEFVIFLCVKINSWRNRRRITSWRSMLLRLLKTHTITHWKERRLILKRRER